MTDPAASGASTGVSMIAAGRFEVQMSPQPGSESVEGVSIGRMSLVKQFTGELAAHSVGEMIAARTGIPNSAGYVAIERVTGELGGRSGTFVLQHFGVMTRGVPSLTLSVVPDSGTGGLAGISGTMAIEIVAGQHNYSFAYEIGASPGA